MRLRRGGKAPLLVLKPMQGGEAGAGLRRPGLFLGRGAAGPVEELEALAGRTGGRGAGRGRRDRRLRGRVAGTVAVLGLGLCGTDRGRGRGGLRAAGWILQSRK